MKQVLEKVLRKIKPSPKEEAKVKKFASEILRIAKTVSGLDAVIVGSIGKFTWLSGDHDVDVFIIFPKETPRDDLEKKGLEYGKKIVDELKGKATVKYAEHPYTHAMVRGFEVDIVPCYRMQKGDHVQSAVDRSPLHLNFVLDHMTPRMQDETRVLKQFCKGISVYGSDAKHMGFSGYICELLMIYYGTFENVIKAAANWNAPQLVDVMGFADKSKFANQPLVIIDPVDKDRNAAAAINTENFIKFAAAAKQFVNNPSARFFTPPEPTPLNAKQIHYLLNRGTTFLAVKMKTPDVIDDVLYPQLRKATKRMGSLLHHGEFAVLRSYEFVSGAMWLVFELEIFELPPIRSQVGPPVSAKQHVAEFLSKYMGKNFVYLDGDTWIAEVKRAHRTADSLVRAFLMRDKEKLVADGVPSYIASVADTAAILMQKDFFAAVKKDKDLSDFLREKYFVDFGRML